VKLALPSRRGRSPNDLRRVLVTPEGIALDVRLAGAGQRAAAFILDTVVIGAMLILLSLLGIGGAIASEGAGLTALLVLWLVGFFILRNFYFVLFELGGRAATPGKRWVGLRVAARDGGRLDADAVIARNLVREIEVYLPLSFLGVAAAGEDVDSTIALLGILWTVLFVFMPLFNRDRLRVGDIVAGTWVIEARKQRLEADLVLPAASVAMFTREQLDAYGVYELQTLEDVLRRGDREALETVASTIRTRIGPSGRWPNDRVFLDAYYSELRAHLERGLAFGRRRRDKHDRSGSGAAG
jgi:uncharacterized RDD family membrane protein YckC